MTGEEKELAANLIFDSLADLAYILALPPEAIGLRGTLNLAFGTGGQMGVQAHYAPYQRELALAKNAGAGALAHEFWHAFDHYIAEKAFLIEQGTSITSSSHTRRPVIFASDCWLKDTPQKSHLLNQRLIAVFNTVFLTQDGSDRHEYIARSVTADKAIARSYFSQPTEIMARAFEAAIESCSDIQNPYLVSGTSRQDIQPVYPDLAHRHQIFSAFQNYFTPLGQALCS